MPADVARLDDALFEASTEVSQLRTGDAPLARVLGPLLEDLRAEVSYLRAALRKGQHLPRAAYLDVRDRLDDVRRRASGDETLNAAGLGPGVEPPPPGPPVDPVELPAGTQVEVRLLGTPAGERPGERLEAAVTRDVRGGGRTVIPAGALMRGLTTAGPAGTPLTVVFDQVKVNYRTYRLRATVMAGDGGATAAAPMITGARRTLRLEMPVAIGR